MGRTWVLLAAVGFTVLGFSAPVRAEELTAQDSAARAAYDRAEVAYRNGELLVALREMEESYRLSQRDDLWYNIARLEDELGRCAAARGHYEQYLERVPQGEARAKAEVAVARLRESCPAAAAPPAAVPVAPAPAVSPPASPPPAPASAGPEPTHAPPPLPSSDPTPGYASTQRWLGWSLVGGGVLAGVGAAYFLDSALDSRSAYRASVERQAAGGERRDEGLQADQDRHERTARVLGVSSLALLVGGAVVVLLAPSVPAKGHSAAVQVQPGLFAASYGRAF